MQPEPVLHRHADHDTALICRPALGYGLCEMIGSVEPVDGWTVCGRAMLQSESWVAIGFRDGDSVCDGCSLPGDPLAVAPDEAEATLW